MTAVPFSEAEQRRIDSAKRYEKAAAQLRKEAEDARSTRQRVEDARIKLLKAAEEIREKEEYAKLRKAQQVDKFTRGLKVMESHFRERVGLYDATVTSLNVTNTAATGYVTMTITLKAKP